MAITSCSQLSEKLNSSPDFLNPPLVSEIYTADPSAHVFNNRIYIYASHDIESGGIEDHSGNNFNMIDYHVLSMNLDGSDVTVHPVGLSVGDVTWAESKFWAPDAAYKNGTYYLYFPAKDANNIFRLGVATSSNPEGPFTPQPTPMQGSYSIDPAVFVDDDGSAYIYFGGIWGGQLQRWENGTYDENGSLKDLGVADDPAILPKMAKLKDDMLEFAEEVKSIEILDKSGNPILTKDLERRFFEAPWIHKHNGIYYLSYSTGDTHLIAYATSDNPYGPFIYQGVLNEPVQGWTNHHSTIKVGKKWFFFYHDTELSGKTHLRNVKFTTFKHNKDGSIDPIKTYFGNDWRF
ncbi:MAG: glycoside hydrolase family 43 protein [Bacteroidetes bacterium]|nr:glycoside hydrolase family 43 protein [Bacteroidota bacterium]